MVALRRGPLERLAIAGLACLVLLSGATQSPSHALARSETGAADCACASTVERACCCHPRATTAGSERIDAPLSTPALSSTNCLEPTEGPTAAPIAPLAFVVSEVDISMPSARRRDRLSVPRPDGLRPRPPRPPPRRPASLL